MEAWTQYSVQRLVMASKSRSRIPYMGKGLGPPNLSAQALGPTHPPPTNTGTLSGDKTSGAQR